ncbi:MAG TPA: flavin monoamine oxidase family protein [Kofleriaceae bacterium]|nr:flavin monoamine oxidase family protein [Kofleriaceae bacterium]
MSSTDVIVVGAGVAGLVAARELVRADHEVIVLEARDRVGGRTLSRTLDGQTIDLGGQWMGDQHHRLRALAAELGVESFAQHAKGKKILARGDGKLVTFSGFLPKIGLLPLLELGGVLRKLERLAKGVPLADPMATRDASQLDAQTVADWLDRHVKRRATREMLELATQMIFAAEPRELSMLYFLLYARSGEGLQRLAEIERGAQERRFTTGMQSISQRLADRLSARVRLDHPVYAVEQDASGVTVHTKQGPLHARRVILALPPALLKKLEITPALPAARLQLHREMAMGSVIKCIASYRRPFWREAGYSGEAFSPGGLVRATFDDCSADGRHAALVAFVVGDAARALSRESPDQRRLMVLGELARLHGPTAAAPVAYVDHDWLADDWATGCYVGLMRPGLLAQTAAAMRAPCGRIHFAGTETATHHIGYIEGAIESAERVVREIAPLLATSSQIQPHDMTAH